jgi:alpha-L-fucosidase
MKTSKTVLFAVTALTCALLPSITAVCAKDAPVVSTETKEHKDARMAWWREARFGMFIHWGLYCVPGGVYQGKPLSTYGEWIMAKAKIPIAEYAAFAPQFNPIKFNADEWVKVAKDAGMKYIVITAKHHEGFAMFPSKASSFNINDATPFKRDPLKELAEACRKQGIKLGFYYSQNLDWHHPGGGVSRSEDWDPSHKGDPDKYVDEIVIPQVKEILTRYGEIPIIWWDIPGGVIDKVRADRIYKTVMECNPNIIMNNRLGGGYKGDTETPEQKIPPQGYPGRDWETCMTINGTWGYKIKDLKFKSTQELLRNLIDIASKGGNYLLNVGPSPEGIIPAGEVERIAEIGKWLQVNGDAIYGTSATIFGEECGSFSNTEKDSKGNPIFNKKWDWRCTVKPGKVYIHILTWPGAVFTLDTKGKTGKLTKAYMLADPKKESLKVSQEGAKLTVSLPDQAPDSAASVLVLETEAK